VSRRATGLVACAAAVVLASGCTSGHLQKVPWSQPVEEYQPPTLAQVDLRIVGGVEPAAGRAGDATVVQTAVADVPGAEGLSPNLQAVIANAIDQFQAGAQPAADPAAPAPSLGWGLVAASPGVVGVRTATVTADQQVAYESEVRYWDDESLAGSTEAAVATDWYDAATTRHLSPSALLTPSAGPELATRLRTAAAADPRIEPANLAAALPGDAGAYDALAFTEDGDLFVEFDAGQLAGADLGPIALAVRADDLLSPFGLAAQQAATSPADPRLPDCAVERCIALTFDDGPAKGTGQLLDVLDSRGVPATFFVIGRYAKGNPEMLARMVREGHVVGNHTMQHPKLATLSAAQIRGELEPVDAIIEAATGRPPTLMRPPYGATNAAVKAVAGELGLAEILWNVDPKDWQEPEAAVLQQRILDNAKPGSIVLSHDSHDSTVAAYPAIIDALLAQGYRLVTVPQLLGDVAPGTKHLHR